MVDDQYLAINIPAPGLQAPAPTCLNEDGDDDDDVHEAFFLNFGSNSQ